MTPGVLIVVSGPSGVGKGTVIREVLKCRPDVWLSISTTTRTPRPGEVDGQDYYFVSQAWFDRAVEAGRFLEHANYAGNSYGTLVTPLQARLDSGDSVLLEIDLAGARQIRAARPDALLVMIVPPVVSDLEARLRGRGTEDEDVLQRRLAVANEELAAAGEFDEVLVNDEISACADKLVQLMDDRPHVT